MRKRKRKKPIRINPKMRGVFTRKAKRKGMSVQKYAKYIVKKYKGKKKTKRQLKLFRQALFAKTAKKWKKKKTRKKRGGAPTPPTYFIVKNQEQYINDFLTKMRRSQNDDGLFLENDDISEDRLENLIDSLELILEYNGGYHFISYNTNNHIRTGSGGIGYFDHTLLSTLPELQTHISNYNISDDYIFPSNRIDLYSVENTGNDSPRSVINTPVGGKRRKKKTRKKR